MVDYLLNQSNRTIVQRILQASNVTMDRSALETISQLLSNDTSNNDSIWDIMETVYNYSSVRKRERWEEERGRDEIGE